MKLSFVGDIMLGRFVRDKWQDKHYEIFSEQVIQYINGSDYVVANLESPITEIKPENSLAFAGGILGIIIVLSAIKHFLF